MSNKLCAVPISKILVVNGKFYAGDGVEFSAKRSEAVVINDDAKLKILIGTVFCRIMNGEIELKRVEAINAKEVEADA